MCLLDFESFLGKLWTHPATLNLCPSFGVLLISIWRLIALLGGIWKRVGWFLFSSLLREPPATWWALAGAAGHTHDMRESPAQ